MFMPTAIHVLFATQTSPFSERLKPMTSPGHKWMWLSCVLPDSSNFVSECEKFIRRKSFYPLDSLLYHRPSICKDIELKCFPGKVSVLYSSNLSPCLQLPVSFWLRTALLCLGRASSPMQIMLAVQRYACSSQGARRDLLSQHRY